MNPIKADKIQFGSTSNMPHITRGEGSSLTFFDPNIGSVAFSSLIPERLMTDVRTVASDNLGADYTSIQDAHDSLSASGGTIVVYQGTYSEQLTITKPVHIIARGEVIVQATDLDIVTVTDTSASFEGVYFKMLTQLGNNNPSVISASSNTIEDKIILRGCTLDTADHLNPEYISTSTLQVISQGSRFLGTGSISCALSYGLEISGNHAPDIELSNMVTQSVISCGVAGQVSLVSASVVLSTRYASCTGDINSTMWTRVISGEVALDNADQADISFTCPLSEGDYIVVFENSQAGEVPVVTARSSTGFSISLGNLITETLKWSIAL